MNSARLPDFAFLRVQTIEEACSSLDEFGGEAAVMASGTDLLVRMRQRIRMPRYLVSLTAVKNLDSISYDEKSGLTIGALATLHNLEISSIIKEKYPLLLQAIHQTSAPPLRYMGTIGGNICMDTRCIFYNQSSDWRKSRPPCFKIGGDICHAVLGTKRCHSVYQGDLAPTLIALGANAKMKSMHGERQMSLNDFYTKLGEHPNVLQQDEILTEIQIPPPSLGSIGSYQKLRIREAIDFPLAAVAVVLDLDKDLVCRKAKLVLGAVAPGPIEVKAVERLLAQKKIGDKVIEEVAEEVFKEAKPVNNLSIEAQYRRKMIKVFARRAIEQVLAYKRGKNEG